MSKCVHSSRLSRSRENKKNTTIAPLSSRTSYGFSDSTTHIFLFIIIYSSHHVNGWAISISHPFIAARIKKNTTSHAERHNTVTRTITSGKRNSHLKDPNDFQLLGTENRVGRGVSRTSSRGTLRARGKGSEQRDHVG